MEDKNEKLEPAWVFAAKVLVPKLLQPPYLYDEAGKFQNFRARGKFPNENSTFYNNI